MKHFFQQKRGFSLVEIIIVLSLLLVIGGFALPAGVRVFQRHAVRDDVKNVARILRSAQSLSMYQKNDSQFGVALVSGNAVLFQGSSYAGRVVAEDRIVPLSPGISVGGPTETVFSKVTGISSVNGTITFTLGLESGTITVNRREINF